MKNSSEKDLKIEVNKSRFTNEDLIENMKEKGSLTSKRVEDAIRAIDRADFIPEQFKVLTYNDQPVPLTENQTISQPSTVAIILQLAEITEGNSVLDIGAGSGWVSALLGYIVGEGGEVDAYEIRLEVAKLGRENLDKYPQLKNIIYINGSATEAYDKDKRYDKIIGGAAFDQIPDQLKKLLKIGGILVIPVNKTLVKVTRIGKKSFKREIYPNFRFVKFVDR